MQEEIRKELLTMVDKKYQEFHSNLCPGTTNILGIRVPVLRAYAKELVKKNNWKEILEWENMEYYEEVMLQGMMIGLAKMSIEETFFYLEKFVPRIDNWAVCDVSCAGLKIAKKYPEEMWKFLQKYITSNQEFEIRFAVVMMLDFYLKEEYIHKVLSILDDIKHDGYYVKMAIAWTISVAYVKFPEITLAYLKKNTLEDFTYNKSIQKIIESNRVSKEEKDFLRKMKRRN